MGERESRLPVFRVTGEPGRRVFAYTDALDEWLHRSPPAEDAPAGAPPVSVTATRFENGASAGGSEPVVPVKPACPTSGMSAVTGESVGAGGSEPVIPEEPVEGLPGRVGDISGIG